MVLSEGGDDDTSDFNIEPEPKTNQSTDKSGQFSNIVTIIVSPMSAFLCFILRK